MEFRLCQGPKDPNLYACRHGWTEFVERGATDNQTYMKCKFCKLVCPIPKGGEYPPECIEHRIRQSLKIMKKIGQKTDKEIKETLLIPSLQESQNEQKKKLELVNAKDFQSPRESGCGECEE